MFPLPYQYMLVQWNLREEKQHNQNEFIAWPSSSTLSCKSQIRTSTPTSTLGSNQLKLLIHNNGNFFLPILFRWPSVYLSLAVDDGFPPLSSS